MKTLDNIQRLYEEQGVKPYGENISQLQHAVQVASLAEINGASDSLIAACLLHDIGHLMFNEQIIDWELNDRHELLGASLLKTLFGKKVSEPVKLHVMAKRYLCGINNQYYDDLSEASKQSLELQGGPLKESEKRSVFERHKYFNEALDLRYWDDEGKNEDNQDMDFSRYMPLLKSLLKSK